LVSSAFVFVLCRDSYDDFSVFAFEYDLLLLFSIIGLALLCFSNDILTVYLALEFQSLAFYALAAFHFNSEFSTESGLKYFVLGALASGFLLFGFSMLYLNFGFVTFDAFYSLNFVSLNSFFCFLFIFFAFSFKMGLFPFHM